MVYHTTFCLVLVFNGEPTHVEFESQDKLMLFVNLVNWARDQMTQGYNKVTLIKLIMDTADSLAIRRPATDRVLPLRVAKACIDDVTFVKRSF